MARKKTIAGAYVEVTAARATGPGNYRSVFGTIQAVLDFLTENRIPMANVIGATYTSNTELNVLYHL